MSFRNGEAILMRDVNSHDFEDRTGPRCTLQARVELYFRKYYRQILVAILLIATVIIFAFFIKTHTARSSAILKANGSTGELEKSIHPRVIHVEDENPE